MKSINGEFPGLQGRTDPGRPSGSGNVNISDGGGAGGVSTRGGGAVLTSDVAQNPSSQNAWTVYGWVVTYNGYLFMASGVDPPPFGRPGELQAGLLVGKQMPQYRPSADNAGPPAPPDPSTFAKLYTWGDALQEFPLVQAGVPISTFTTFRTPRIFTNILQAPVKIEAGELMQMVLILGLGIYNNLQLQITEARWTILYDLS